MTIRLSARCAACVVALAATTLGAVLPMIPGFERPAAPVPASFPQAAPTEASAVAPLADSHRLARLLRRRAPARGDRARARQQPRPARRRAEHRACARPVRHPARRPLPVDRGQRRAERAARAGRPERDEAGRHQPPVLRQPRIRQLRARLLRPRAQPGGAGAADLPRHRGGPPQRADQPGGRGRQRLAAPGRRPRAPGAGERHAADPPGIPRSREAQLRAGRSVRARSASGRHLAAERARRCRALRRPWLRRTRTRWHSWWAAVSRTPCCRTGSSWRSPRWRNCPPGCLPKCWRVVPTSCRPNAPCWQPTPASVPRAQPSSRASR